MARKGDLAVCPICGKVFPRKYRGNDNPTCSKECASKRMLNTWKNKTSEEIEEIVKRRENSCIKKYGCKNVVQCKEIANKISDSHKLKTEEEVYMSNQKRKQTCMQKYGVESISQLPEIQEKVRETNFKKYDAYYPMQNEEYKNNQINNFKEKYNGLTNPGQLESSKEKSKQTKLKRHHDCYYNNNEKTKQTKLERYGNENYNNSEKTISTKRKNHTFNTSKPEQEITTLLKEKFPDLKVQYKSDLYPFCCDFYIPNLDLYIEYQGFWSHNNHPFTNSYEDQTILNEWQEKALSSKFFSNAINTWTIRDPLKRQIAKENNLNWLEFWNMQEFLEWYNAL